MNEKTLNPASGQTRAEIALLLDFYGSLLTERQRQMAEWYFQDDLSLAEIADMTEITRQGVRDGLKKAEATLFRLEEQLGVARRYRARKKLLSDALEATEDLPSGEAKDRVRSCIEQALNED